jgi:hypothetical protein
MEFEQKIIIRFLFKEGLEGQDIHSRLSAQFGDARDTLRSAQRWCQYVRPGKPQEKKRSHKKIKENKMKEKK